MSNLNLKASAGIDLSTPFCAYTYCTGLRAQGCEPVVQRGALYINLESGASASEVGRWAARHDPKGTLRIEYARMMWSARASDDEIIRLGAAPELA